MCLFASFIPSKEAQREGGGFSARLQRAASLLRPQDCHCARLLNGAFAAEARYRMSEREPETRSSFIT